MFNFILSDVEEMVRRSQEVRKSECDGNEASTSTMDTHARDGVDETKQGNLRCREFKAPENDIVISDMSRKKFAPKSKSKIMWAVNMYCEWRKNRLKAPLVPPQVINADLD